MKKIVIILLIVLISFLVIFIFNEKNSEIKKYENYDIRIDYYSKNEIILNEISDFLLNNQEVEEIRKSKSCYQNNCKQIGDYIVIGSYEGNINYILEKMSQIDLYSAVKVFDNNKNILYNYLSLFSTHNYFVAYKKCVSDSCLIQDDYYERIINGKCFYYKENRINDFWSTIYTDIPSL